MSKHIEKTPSEERLGLVISYFGNSVAVESKDGQVFQCHLRRNQELPVVGDEVIWQLDQGETGVIKRILPRRSLLGRGDGRGEMRPIAANVDHLLAVMSPPPVFAEYLIDRYTVAAELLGIKPIIILNKADLISPALIGEVSERLLPYRAIPYPVMLTSVISREGLSELNQLLAGKTAVLVGPSGVGKSSLISALGGDATIRVGDVSAKGAGKHTTTATRLYHLEGNGRLIDSPGVREFNLWPVSEQEVLKGFKEFQAFLSGCKFRDCKHTVEPGCAVQIALKDGKISQNRFDHYLALMKEAKPKSYK